MGTWFCHLCSIHFPTEEDFEKHNEEVHSEKDIDEEVEEIEAIEKDLEGEKEKDLEILYQKLKKKGLLWEGE